MDGRCRTGEVVDRIDFDEERETNVVAHRLEAAILEEMRKVLFPAGKIIIDAEHFVALGDQPLAEMGAEEAGAAGYQDTLSGRFHRFIRRLLDGAARRRIGKAPKPASRS